MESNYYTPSIDEFYIGFEYEYLSSTEDEEYTKAKILKGEDIDTVFNNFKVKVEYLNKKDIENLNYTVVLFSDTGIKANKELIKNSEVKGLIMLDYDKIFNRLSITFKPDSIKDLTGMSYYYKTLYKGIIKNKSDFEKVEAQIQRAPIYY